MPRGEITGSYFPVAVGDTLKDVAIGGDPEELTEAERARYRAARAASSELGAAFESGDAEERRAAAGQLLQAISHLDPKSTLDKLHIPDDAGEYAAQLRRIMLRIPDGWGRWISTGPGWYPIIVELDQQLAAIDPDYELHQCKEKFAGLRYYFSTARTELRARMNSLVAAAEKRCASCCEECGGPGALHVSLLSYLRTLCAACAIAGGYGLVGEPVDALAPDTRGVWRVATQDSTYVVNLNRGELDGDEGRYRISRVDAWPAVGGVFRVVVEGGAGDGDDQWVVSSVISRIERIR